MIYSKFKTLAATAVFACTATFAHAAPVATFDVVGEYSTIVNGLGIEIAADFEGEILDPTISFSDVNDYEFGAALTIDGFSVFDDSFIIEDTSFDEIGFAIASIVGSLDPSILGAIGSALSVIVDNTGDIEPIAPGVFFSFLGDITLFTPTEIEGDFVSYLGTTDSPEFRGGEAGDFSLALTIDTVTPVPLPATLPMLAFGLGALGWVSRRRS